MTDSDVKSIITDLDRWASGQLGSKLTWSILEDRFEFSRQSLQAKAEIKALRLRKTITSRWFN